MGISVVCGECGTSGTAPDAAAGRKVKCRNCGGVIPVPADSEAVGGKFCCVCGVDVSNQKRTKDQAGNYYCKPCWAEKIAEAARAQQEAAENQAPIDLPDEGQVDFGVAGGGGGRPAAPVVTRAGMVLCPVCQHEVSPSEMTTDDLGDPLCQTCSDERNLRYNPLAPPPPIPTTPVKAAAPAASAGERQTRAPGAQPTAVPLSYGTPAQTATIPGDMGVGDWIVAIICPLIGIIAGVVWMSQKKEKGKSMLITSLIAAAVEGAINAAKYAHH